MLVKWKGEEASEAIWGDYYVMKEKFPRFDLADKVHLRGGGGGCQGPMH